MRWLLAIVLLLGVPTIGCERSKPPAPAPIELDGVVRVTAAPVGWMTERIAGGAVPVEMLCPNGQSPRTWHPDPETVAMYQRASLIITNGARLESWVSMAPLPRSRVVQTARAIEGDLLIVRGETHSHGPSGEHAHNETLGHTWLDPINAIAQAGSITDALSAAFPEHADIFQENFAVLTAELQQQSERLRAIAESSNRIAASENPLGYLARRYGWPTIQSEELPGGWVQQIGRLRDAGTLAKSEIILIVSDQDQPSAQVNTPSEEPGFRIVTWNTGESQAGQDYLAILAGNIDRLQAAAASLRQEP